MGGAVPVRRRQLSWPSVSGFMLAKNVMAHDEGTPKMQEIAKAIQEGAAAYLRRQFKTIGIILVPLAVIVFLTSTEIMKPDGTEALSFGLAGLWRTAGVHPRLSRIGCSPASSA